jgi:hypothetical protein
VSSLVSELQNARRMRTFFLTGALLLAGCAPIFPFHLGETAEVLKPKQVRLQVAGGGGNIGASRVGLGPDDPTHLNDCCGGGSLSVRVGVGHGQEVGVETGVAWAGSVAPSTIGILFAHKLSIQRWLALVTRTGFAADPQEVRGYWSSDVALIGSTPLLRGVVSIYGGLRHGVSLRIDQSPVTTSAGVGGALILPLGLQFALGRVVRLFTEGGFLGSWNRGAVEAGLGTPPYTYAYYGGYGVIGFDFLFGGTR